MTTMSDRERDERKGSRWGERKGCCTHLGAWKVMFPRDSMRPSVQRSSCREGLPLDVVSGTRLVPRGSRAACVTIGTIGRLVAAVGCHVAWCFASLSCRVVAVD